MIFHLKSGDFDPELAFFKCIFVETDPNEIIYSRQADLLFFSGFDHSCPHCYHSLGGCLTFQFCGWDFAQLAANPFPGDGEVGSSGKS